MHYTNLCKVFVSQAVYMLLITGYAITTCNAMLPSLTLCCANVHVAHTYVADLYVGAMDED